MKETKAQLRRLNEILEKRVNERTRELSINIKELKKSQKQLRLLANHIESVREEESIRIAREIHDELGQSLSALKMMMLSLGKKSIECR